MENLPSLIAGASDSEQIDDLIFEFISDLSFEKMGNDPESAIAFLNDQGFVTQLGESNAPLKMEIDFVDLDDRGYSRLYFTHPLKEIYAVIDFQEAELNFC